MKRLTLEREKRGLSRAELARRAKMSAGDVGKIENGRVQAYRVQLVKLGRAMRMRVPESLTLGDDASTEEETAARVAARARRRRPPSAAEIEKAAEVLRSTLALEDDPKQTTVAELLARGGAQ